MESTGQHHVRTEKMLNPFSSHDRQHFPEFSPMFRKKTPTSSEGKAFRWSIDQLAILNPAQIDTPGFMHHSPDNDERQKEIDQYFSKTVLPSPWPAMKHPASSHTHNGTKPHTKRVTFSPLPPSAAFIQEKGLVESSIRNSVAVDAGTQTALTIPMNFDLEKLLVSALCHTHSGRGREGKEVTDGELVGGVVCEGPSEDLARDLGNTSLRRKLFGQPDRQGSGEGVGGEDVISPTFVSLDVGSLPPSSVPRATPLSSATPSPLANGSTPSHLPPSNGFHLTNGNFCSPAIVLTRPANHTPNSSGHSPLQSSMLLHTPGSHFSLSPIRSEGVADEGKCQDSPGLSPGLQHNAVPEARGATALKREGNPDSNRTASPSRATNSAKCTSTPNATTMKRQLAPSPFASPVLKHPCTARNDETDSPARQQSSLVATPTCPSPSSCSSPSDSSFSDEDAPPMPLSLADLRTQTSDLTGVTSTACTGYFNAMCLEDDSERDITGMDSNARLHPLHSTAAHLGPTHLSNWLQTPVHFARSENQADSGVGGFTEFTVESGRHKNSGSLHVLPKQAPPPILPFATHMTSASSSALSPSASAVSAASAWQSSATNRSKQSVLSTIPEQSPQIQMRGSGSTLDGHTHYPPQAVESSDSGLALTSSFTLASTPVSANRQLGDGASTVGVATSVGSTPVSNSAESAHSTPQPSSVTNKAISSGAPKIPNLHYHHYPHSSPSSKSNLHLSNCLLPPRLKFSPQTYYYQQYHLNGFSPTYPTSHVQTTPTSSSSAMVAGGGIAHASSSAHTTPHRFSSGGGGGFKNAVGVVLKKDGVAYPPLFSGELLKRKELLKARLNSQSPIRTEPCSSSPCHHSSLLNKIRSPLQPNSPRRPFPSSSLQVLKQYWSPPHALYTRGAHSGKENLTGSPATSVTPSSHRTRDHLLF